MKGKHVPFGTPPHSAAPPVYETQHQPDMDVRTQARYNGSSRAHEISVQYECTGSSTVTDGVSNVRFWRVRGLRPRDPGDHRPRIPLSYPMTITDIKFRRSLRP